MNKEEEAIEILRDYVKDFEYEGKYPYLSDSIICIDNLIDKQRRNINKLINYIAVRENKDYEDVRKEFDI